MRFFCVCLLSTRLIDTSRRTVPTIYSFKGSSWFQIGSSLYFKKVKKKNPNIFQNNQYNFIIKSIFIKNIAIAIKTIILQLFLYIFNNIYTKKKKKYCVFVSMY